MKIPEKSELMEKTLRVFVVVGLVAVILNPLGYIAILKFLGVIGRLHTLTFLLMSYLALCFWRKIKNAYFLMRLFLTSVLCWSGYYWFEMVWELECALATPLSTPLTYFFMRLLFANVLPWFIILYVKNKRKNLEIPFIQKKRFASMFVVNFIMTLWLESTGFFSRWIAFKYFPNYAADPSNWAWFVVKTVTLLSWLYIVGFNFQVSKITKKCKVIIRGVLQP